MTDKPIWQRSAVEMSALLDAREITAVDLLDEFERRLEKLNPQINAFAFVDRKGAREAARAAVDRQARRARLGPLDGVPISIKDNLYVDGLPAEWGSRLFKGNVPGCDDICVERLRAAGAIIVGKSATAEFALSGRTETAVLGTTRNPWNLTLTSGGSSGGAVASVAVGLTPLAIGTDAGGSIRLPASYTGLVGLRPSNGRIPRRYGFPPMALDFQAIGLVARTVDDVAALFDVLSGPDRRDPVSLNLKSTGHSGRLKIGTFVELGSDGPDAPVRTSLNEALEVLSCLGHDVTPCGAPFDVGQFRTIWELLTSVGAARVAQRFQDWESQVTKSLAAIIGRGLRRTASEYVEGLDLLQTFRADVSASWSEYDLLAIPTGPSAAWPAEFDFPIEIGGKPGSGAVQGMYCGWVNAMGYAGLSLPGRPHPDGRPIGIQLIARSGGDEMLLGLAREYEAASPWVDRWPALASTPD